MRLSSAPAELSSRCNPEGPCSTACVGFVLACALLGACLCARTCAQLTGLRLWMCAPAACRCVSGVCSIKGCTAFSCWASGDTNNLCSLDGKGCTVSGGGAAWQQGVRCGLHC